MNSKSKTVIMAGAAAALAASPALAAQPTIPGPAVPVAASYAELLEPISNASLLLQLSDAEWAAKPPRLIEAQYEHHHHHHHHHSQDWYQQNGYVYSNGAWVMPPVAHHHHHHHHHHHEGD